MNPYNLDSIKLRFTIGLATVITIVMLTFSSVLILYNSRSMEAELNNQLERLTAFSKESLASALWQYNYDYVKDYIESLFLYEDLVFANVITNEMEINKIKHKDFKEWSFEEFRRSQGFIAAETKIMYQDVKVGNCQLVISRERVRRLILVTSALVIFILLLVNLAIFWNELPAVWLVPV